MLRHIVLFKLKDPSPAVCEEMKRRLLSLKGQVPELLDIEVGFDIVRSERSYDVALNTTFESLEAMQAYQVHPAHVEVAEYIATIRESAVAADYQV